MTIDHNSATPLHLQAQQLLRELIESDEYKNGKMLPKEIELAEQLHISRNTCARPSTNWFSKDCSCGKRAWGRKWPGKASAAG